jgi:hypothetical protein
MEEVEKHKMTPSEDEEVGVIATSVKIAKPKLGQPSASEESASPYPDMELCQDIHKVLVKTTTISTASKGGDLITYVLTRIKNELENPSLYEKVEADAGVNTGIWSPEELTAQKETNKQHIDTLEKKVEEAKESAGDMEVMDARVLIARFSAKSLTEEEALSSYKKLLELAKISSGKKIDAMMESSRVASFYGDAKKASEFIDSVRQMEDTGRSFVVVFVAVVDNRVLFPLLLLMLNGIACKNLCYISVCLFSQNVYNNVYSPIIPFQFQLLGSNTRNRWRGR